MVSRLGILGQTHRPSGGDYFPTKAATVDHSSHYIQFFFHVIIRHTTCLLLFLISWYSWREWFGWVVVWEKVTSFKCWVRPLS